MVNFYHRFIPAASRIMRPLFASMKGKPLDIVMWDREKNDAFELTKTTLANATLLHHPVDGAETSLVVDASSTALGGVLQQKLQGVWCPLGFYSRVLLPTETRYATFDRELLAIRMAIRHFRFFVEGRVFHVLTDHMPLTHVFGKISDAWSDKQRRHISEISEYTTDVRHISGPDNMVADALSRVASCEIDKESNASIPPALKLDHAHSSGKRELLAAECAPSSCVLAVVEGLDVKCFRDAQAACAETQGLRDKSSSLTLVDVPFDEGGNSLLCDTSTGKNRPVVPLSLRRQVFNTIHQLAHPGIRATRRLICERFLWHGMARDVGEWVRQCLDCQRSKVCRHVHAPLQSFPLPDTRFSHIHVDVVGPLPPSRGYTHLLTIVDRFTRWPEAIPLMDTSSLSLARALLSAWIARFGVPVRVTSDRGAQFTSQLWSDLSELLGMKLSATTAYHPQANGLVERLHRRLKEALKARLKGPDWADQLPWILLGLRTEPKEDLKASTAELVYGTPILIPGELVVSASDETETPFRLRQLRERMGSLRPVQTSRHGDRVSVVPARLMEARYVFVRRGAHSTPLQRPYEGPFEVIQPGKKHFRVKMGTRNETITVDRLKAAHLDPSIDPPTIIPPKRGRPPRPRPLPPEMPSVATRRSTDLPTSPRQLFSRAGHPLRRNRKFDT